jgi:tRNA(adenine34) deaminase
MTDQDLMDAAYEQAKKSYDEGGLPIGSVLYAPATDQIVARGHNLRVQTGDPTAHAEILALRDAAEATGSWRLTDCTLVVTLEPCLMCGGAAVNSRLQRLVYGAADMAAGACLSLYNVCDDPRLNHRVELTSGVEAEACAELLNNFFAARR